jgi:alkanesulfonate monooxygenase SsuD/methylene tetrahydromethanopterin reductase-like flavin-dependent oxidoreductase (luciferase family)
MKMVVPWYYRHRCRNLTELCRRAEATGADSLWAVDHLFWPHPINECLTTLAVAAVTTTTADLGSCVLQLPLRQPSAVAKQATALQHLSGGGSFSASAWAATRRVRAGRRRLPPARPAHGRGHRRAPQGLGRPTMPAAPTTPGAGLARCPVDRGLEPGRPPTGRRRRRRLGALFLTPTTTGPLWRPCGARRAEAGRDPDAVQPAWSSSPVSETTTRHPLRGAQWLSELYGLPTKAFDRHLVAGLARDVCRGAGPLRRSRGPPHPRDGGRITRSRRSISGSCVRLRGASPP